MKNAVSASVIFIGAFLLFGVQPMVGRLLLPVFGGVAGVWIVCLAVFQVLLLAGYFYADRIAALSRTVQNRIHVTLLVLAVVWIFGVERIRPEHLERFGLFGVVLLVVILVGFPFVLLSANSSLVQAWSRGSGGNQSRSVYRLYALSNAGSLLGLLFYPFAIEPLVGLDWQWRGFGIGLALYSLLLFYFVKRGTSEPQKDTTGGHAEHKNRVDIQGPKFNFTTLRFYNFTTSTLWFLLPAISTFLLNSVCAHLLGDVSPLPMIWVLPLALFLLSYILGFSGKLDRVLGYLGLATIAIVLGALLCMDLEPAKGLEANLFSAAGLLLVGGSFLHGWLYKVRPEQNKLTTYYLWISIGGAVGGCAASIGAPLLLQSVREYPVSLFVLLGTICVFLCSKINLETWDGLDLFKQVHFKKAVCLAVVAVLGFGTYKTVREHPERVVLEMRNFYGYSWVTSAKLSLESGRAFPMNSFYHGTTKHGFQIKNEFYNQEPTIYFGRNGVGQAFVPYSNQTIRVAVLGLGIGTIACYAKPGDTFRFYEINPDVVKIASDTNLFTYVSGCKGTVELVTADARQALEKERTAKEELYDVIVLDVYNGDSIPLHLATREAFRLYLDRLKPDGIIALHLTNWHLNLMPMAQAAAKDFGLNAAGVVAMADEFSFSSFWAYLSRRKIELGKEGFREVDFAKVKEIPLMSDNKNSLLPYLSLDPSPPVKDIEIRF